ncbi:hypothetical protein HS125_02250 [bacterium]|nr:hypothetical protein [bacterium]
MNLESLDRRWVFLGVAVLTFGGLLLPFRLPQVPGETSISYYNALQNLPPGSLVMISADYSPSTRPELEPMHRLTIYHALKNGHRVINIALWDVGVNQTALAMGWALAQLASEGVHPRKDVDYLNLGFKAGGEVVMSQMGSSIPTTFRKDQEGRYIWENAEIPVVAGLHDMKDVDLLVTISAGSPGINQWLAQVQKRYNVATVAGVTAVMAPELYTFYHSRQLLGFLGGLVGAADYEKLLGMTERGDAVGLSILVPDFANRAMVAQSLIHYALVLVIIIVNVDFILRRRARGGRS